MTHTHKICYEITLLVSLQTSLTALFQEIGPYLVLLMLS